MARPSACYLPGDGVVIDGGGSYFQFVRRWYTGCHRGAALEYVAALVQRCQSTAGVIIEGALRAMAADLSASAQRAHGGLQHLQATYSGDSASVAKIGLVASKLQEVLLRLKPLTEEA